MDFKKDYINYVLYTVIQNDFYGDRDDVRVRKILEKIILTPDVAKAAFLMGKTAGLEILFKYMLYISDKIDKSQITVFNLKDNFDYDLQNLKKICDEIKKYRGAIRKPAEEIIPEQEILEPQEEELKPAEEISAEIIAPESFEAEEYQEEIQSDEGIPESAAETADAEKEQGFTLIENNGGGSSDDEVFGLEGITRSIEMEEEAESVKDEIEEIAYADEQKGELSEIEEESIIENVIIKQPQESYFETEEDDILTASDIEKINRLKENESKKKEELEIEIRNSSKQEETGKNDAENGSVTSEAYNRFENKFFEEVKILEKLFSNTEKDCKEKPLVKLNEKSLQSFSEIIEISSGLANLTRQLSLDLTADIFFTINLLFTKAINNPSVINPARLKILSSSLHLVTSLIRGEDYLGYDELVKKIESLKEELTKPAEPKIKTADEKPQSKITPSSEKPAEPVSEPKHETEADKQEKDYREADKPEADKSEEKELINKEAEPETELESAKNEIESAETESKQTGYPKEIVEKPGIDKIEGENRNIDTVLFKMKYLVKEFEKNFSYIVNAEGEYSKYEILDEIDNLNSLLRILAKISASVKNTDVLKLSEVSYVFLKYLKDYRMDLLEPEIQQIVKYIIFTFKMLLTDRKPEDFDVLVQYLNNPVKIFTDT